MSAPAEETAEAGTSNEEIGALPNGYGPPDGEPTSSSDGYEAREIKTGWRVSCLGSCVVVAIAVLGMGAYWTKRPDPDRSREAYNTMSAISRYALAAYEREAPSDDPQKPAAHRLCPSWPHPIPEAVPHGTKITPDPSDWNDPGVKCLRFSFSDPMHYQYDYRETATGFAVYARGDIDGDGVESEYELDGEFNHVGDIMLGDVRELHGEH